MIKTFLISLSLILLPTLAYAEHGMTLEELTDKVGYLEFQAGMAEYDGKKAKLPSIKSMYEDRYLEIMLEAQALIDEYEATKAH